MMLAITSHSPICACVCSERKKANSFCVNRITKILLKSSKSTHRDWIYKQWSGEAPYIVSRSGQTTRFLPHESRSQCSCWSFLRKCAPNSLEAWSELKTTMRSSFLYHESCIAIYTPCIHTACALHVCYGFVQYILSCVVIMAYYMVIIMVYTYMYRVVGKTRVVSRAACVMSPSHAHTPGMHACMLCVCTLHWDTPSYTGAHPHTLGHTLTHWDTPSHTQTHLTHWDTPSHSGTHAHTGTHHPTLGHIFTHWDTLRHTLTHCDTPSHTVTHPHTLRHTLTHCDTPSHTATLSHTATHPHTLGHTLTHCDTPSHNGTHPHTLEHTLTHCNTPSHTVTHPHTLRHTLTCWDTPSHTGTPSHTATHPHIRRHTLTHWDTPSHTGTHHTLGHTLTCWDTPSHTGTHPPT